MNPTETLIESVVNDMRVLPEDTLREVRDFVRFKRDRIPTNVNRLDENEKARRSAAFERLMKFRGTLDRKIDIKQELTEAYTEMYENSFRH
ncbi:MAG: hypothetical protein FWG05_00340 [Kiritimatiellaeota bacterium]|nr:hypothetical protein [Kiritimatiellota bacterium]